MKVNYTELEHAVRFAIPYTHGSSHAETHTNSNGELEYNVWSYNTLMLTVVAGHVTYYNDRHYSTTTSRLQNIIKRNWDVEKVAA